MTGKIVSDHKRNSEIACIFSSFEMGSLTRLWRTPHQICRVFFFCFPATHEQESSSRLEPELFAPQLAAVPRVEALSSAHQRCLGPFYYDRVIAALLAEEPQLQQLTFNIKAPVVEWKRHT